MIKENVEVATIVLNSITNGIEGDGIIVVKGKKMNLINILSEVTALLNSKPSSGENLHAIKNLVNIGIF